MYVLNNPLMYVDPTGHETQPGFRIGIKIDIARKSGGSASQVYWSIKSELGVGRKWGDVDLSRNQFLYLFNLATMTVFKPNGQCRNATKEDAAHGYTEDKAAWAKRELMKAYDKQYIKTEEAIESVALGMVGGPSRIRGWIKRETYKEIAKSLGKEAQMKFASSMIKGFANAYAENFIWKWNKSWK
ncbi:hypothetical protein E5161_10430 [Cohnella pontilimi]|uniref:Uncharacterized protein n=1 Tax=Cohnella pontilimi TaxID=2564100 RepID=A0A4U0FCF1_9BACL|nr:hypothetical protein [Cohnella pontilimi]TJY42401.1 hypothetical protein E5161_10430 [Cohnella pontilimi]